MPKEEGGNATRRFWPWKSVQGRFPLFLGVWSGVAHEGGPKNRIWGAKQGEEESQEEEEDRWAARQAFALVRGRPPRTAAH